MYVLLQRFPPKILLFKWKFNFIPSDEHRLSNYRLLLYFFCSFTFTCCVCVGQVSYKLLFLLWGDKNVYYSEKTITAETSPLRLFEVF